MRVAPLSYVISLSLYVRCSNLISFTGESLGKLGQVRVYQIYNILGTLHTNIYVGRYVLPRHTLLMFE